MKRQQVLVFFLASALSICGMSTLYAASNPTISVTTLLSAGTCPDSEFDILSGWDAVDSDGINCDVVGMIAYDAAGVPVASDWECYVPPATGNVRHTEFGGSWGNINDMTARPLTIELYDLDFEPAGGSNFQAQYDEIANAGAPVLRTLNYDPAADVPACGSLPLLVSTTTATPIPTLSTWAMLLLALALVLVTARRSRTSAQR